MITPESPCEAMVTPGADGGLRVDVFIPTYAGGATLSIDVERSNDGDWQVFIPWPDGLGDDQYTINSQLADACGGIVYLGAPDVPTERAE